MRIFCLLILLVLPPLTLAQDFTRSIKVCGACHKTQAESFKTSPHGLAMAAENPELLDRSCATCHGPVGDHLRARSPESINGSPGNQACQRCHANSGGTLSLSTPAHKRHDLNCTDCHAASHSAPGHDQWLLTAHPTKMCGECHREQRNAGEMPFAHQDGDQPMACTECHSLHSARRVSRLARGSQAGACLECHTEKAGPHVFAHTPVVVDGCQACHQPHGSTNPRLLKRRQSMNLCLECHADVPVFHDLTESRFRDCLGCHTAIHGSNRDSSLFDE